MEREGSNRQKGICPLYETFRRQASSIRFGAWLNLATTYHALGRYKEAEKMKVEVLALRRELLGDKHPDTVRSMANASGDVSCAWAV